MYKMRSSHPRLMSNPLVSTTVGSWNRRVSIAFPEFVSQGKMAWGLPLPTVTKLLHRPQGNQQWGSTVEHQMGGSPGTRSTVLGLSNPERPQPQLEGLKSL